MAIITDLPGELIDHILDSVTAGGVKDGAVESLALRRVADSPSIVRQKLINSLAPTCRKFHAYLKPELHRVIFITKRNIFPRMFKLHRLLGATPQPGVFQNTTQFVVEYDEDPFLARSCSDKAGYGKISNRLESLKAATRAAGFKDMDGYWVSIEKVGREAIGSHVPLQRGHSHRLGLLAQLIILRLPNVEYVCLPYCMMDLLQPLDVTKVRQKLPPRLKSLRITKVCNGDGRPGIAGMTTARCGIFGKYGYIKDLFAQDLETGLPPAEFEAFSWLTRLVLWRCATIDAEHMDLALKRLSKLQTFVYSNDRPSRSGSLSPRAQKYLALRFPDTLTTLCVDAPLAYRNDCFAVAPAFSALPKLENLWLRTCDLYLSTSTEPVYVLEATGRHDRYCKHIPTLATEGSLANLPKSLARLHIAGDPWRIRKDVKWLEVAVAEKRLPNLKEIAVEPLSEGADDAHETFWKRCEADLYNLDRQRLAAQDVKCLSDVDPRPYLW